MNCSVETKYSGVPGGGVPAWSRAFPGKTVKSSAGAGKSISDTLGAPAYGAAQLEAQKKAVYDAGYDSWTMWNPGSIYDVYMPALEKTTVSRKRALAATSGTPVNAASPAPARPR